MTDNFKRYKEYITLLGGLPETNEKGNLDKYYVVELIRRGKDNPDMSAANYHFRNYYIYSWRDLDRYENEIKEICKLLRLRAYCSVNYKLMSQVALDTLAESARRIAAHDYKKFYNIFESCSGSFFDGKKNQLWVIDIDDVDSKTVRDISDFRKYIDAMESGYEQNVVYTMPTKSGLHLICHPFNVAQYHSGWDEQWLSRIGSLPDIKKNHITLLYEDL